MVNVSKRAASVESFKVMVRKIQEKSWFVAVQRGVRLMFHYIVAFAVHFL